MITRLKVDGFKNLQGLDVRFGPFTCIAGPNGVGKSNLFDAIHFLSRLADGTLAEAAAAVRGTGGRVGEVRALFAAGADGPGAQMRFEVEMLIPSQGRDELGQPAEAASTFLRYELGLGRRSEAGPEGPLVVLREALGYITQGEAARALPFPHSPGFRASVVTNRRTVPFIETIEEEGRTFINLRADSPGGGGGGRPRKLLAKTLPRTALSSATDASEHRTLVLARQEMRSWTLLQLEPSALRAPDPLHAPARVGANGAHLPAALRGLAREAKARGLEPEDAYQQVANRLAELYEDVRIVGVEEDPHREQLSVAVTELRGARISAASLSDGTLRFLALTLIEAGRGGPPLLCLEEPENGIHPDRVPAMLNLLQDIAVDADLEVGEDNPLRQVIVNTHAPEVVKTVPAGALLLADVPHCWVDGRIERHLRLRPVQGTWGTEVEGVEGAPAPWAYLKPAEAPPRRRWSGQMEMRLIDRADARAQLERPPYGRAADQ